VSSDFEIRFDQAVEAELKGALKKMRAFDLTAPLSVLGDELLETFKHSFAAQESPAGAPWAPLAPRTQRNVYYKRRGERGGEHILRARETSDPGWFERQLRAQTTTHSLAVGEHAGPAAIAADYGDRATGQPGRPFLQVTDAMEDRAATLLLGYLGKLW